MTEAENKHVSGFVSILGRPNAGKSTLLNALVGMKVAIVADKPQTTRTSIQGVLTEPGCQIVFLDTPGIHKAGSSIQKRMMDAVRNALDERDVLLFLVDASVPVSPPDRQAVSLLQKSEAPAIAVFNKIDLVREKGKLLPLIEEYQRLHPFAAYVPISASKGEGLAELKKEIVERLPEGPLYFPEDHVTDQPERFLAAELIREKALLLTREEVPHSIAVLIDRWDETPPGTEMATRIFATIYVERDGQKRILVGAKGSMLKRIGTLAREEMEKLLGVHIYLSLFVKVAPDWREKAAFLNAIDWRTMTGADEN
jgi:GTP-binding protein Era